MNTNSIFENLSDFSNWYVDKIHRSKEDDDANIAFLCNRKEAVLQKHLSSPTSSSDWYDKNMYSNYYLLNKSCAYLKSKCVKDTVLDPYRMEEERTNGNHQANLRYENDEKDGHTCVQSYPYDNAKVRKKRTFHFKIDKEKASDLGTCNGNISSDILLYNSEYDDGKYQDKIETYDFLKECEYENGTNSADRTKYDDDGSSLEMLHILEKEKDTNISDIQNFSVRTHSYRHSGETYAEQKKPSSSNMSKLMKIKFLINKKKNSSNRKNGSSPFSDYKNNNTFVKFLMAEIKIETKLYKLILFLFLLILLSLFKDMSNYIVITRKCYNIYENPIKSIKRILKCVIWALKIGHKFSSPFILYMLSFFGVIIFRILLLLNIPIFLLLLYCKFFLKNEEPTVKLYLLFVVNMYKYIVFHFVHILKNYSNHICFRDFLSVIYVSFHFIFVSLYRIVHRIYAHKVR
ncbi:hypothetical protein PCYB_083490 [Plasmodium cynomolgi strain B]|uniref:Uncharacterized protein n=1 Tax=Plasmodium cynomolgi (strain B) TaxID=1120755 RepID=K6UJS2_PLACD|nr:hypothetical protein PCYB_083490 [Plasmodium cynomolgi strain B]GAB66188.1 hypothetical protein PCYB_083490 [Plasmodium cynomolgi strain B]